MGEAQHSVELTLPSAGVQTVEEEQVNRDACPKTWVYESTHILQSIEKQRRGRDAEI